MGITIFRPGQRLVIPSPGVQVWTPSVSAGGSFTGVLDGVSNVAAAYALRQLRSAYSDGAVRVRRSSDNAEQDIGFDGSGEFDAAAFSAFVGGGTGYVKTWYDQSGNGRDATQTTTANQPQIVLSVVNGKPILRFTTSRLSTSVSPLNGLSEGTMLVTMNAAANTVDTYMVSCPSTGSANGFDIYARSGGFGSVLATSAITVITGNKVYAGTGAHMVTVRFYAADALSEHKMFIDGGAPSVADNASATINAAQGTVTIGDFRPTGLAAYAGDLTEVILLSSAISTANHNTIGNDMATRYGLSWTTVT